MHGSTGSTSPAGSTASTGQTSRAQISPYALIGEWPEHRDYLEGERWFPIVHAARIEAFCTVDCGTERFTTVGKSWLMKGVHVGHDATIGDHCELAPHVAVGGWCEISDHVKIGMGAVIRNRVKVGYGARIGMGAVVTKDVPAGAVWVGNPAAPIGADRFVDPLWNEWWDGSRRAV